MSLPCKTSTLVTFPTRGNNTLDKCFTTHPDSVLSFEQVPGFSDHDAVILSVQTQTHMSNNIPDPSTCTSQLTGIQSEKNCQNYHIFILS